MGRAYGKQATLRRLLNLKFGELTSQVEARIASATETDLDLWRERLLSADTLEAVFSDAGSG